MEEELAKKNWQQFEKTGCIEDYLHYRGLFPSAMQDLEGSGHEGDNRSYGNGSFRNAHGGIR
jgi:hypothetical protein